MRRTASLVATILAFTSGLATAGSYAAMDEVPVEGGELRLAQPIVEGPGGGETIGFPLRETHVTAHVSGPMAQYCVEQVFENPFDDAIEAVYVFPLGDEAAVIDYSIVVGDRTIAGEIKKRDEARQIYEQAKNEGHTSALLEQEKANVFSQNVANIAPRETVKVRFCYVETVGYADGRYELVYPLVVGPRYLPAGNQGRHPVGAHVAGSSPPPGGAVSIPYVDSDNDAHQISFTARIDAGFPIGNLRSPTHQMTVQTIDATTATATLAATDAIPNRDLILRWDSASPTTTVGLLAHRDPAGGYFTLVLQPKAEYKTGDIAPREVVILIDHSGSMDGGPLDEAKTIAKGLLGTLNERDTFNVMAFASGLDKLEDDPIRADDAGRRRGTAWIDGIGAGDGTELEQGILTSLATKPGHDRVRLVYLITDGFVGNDDTILAAVQKYLGHNRIFSVGVGSAPNRYLLDHIAQLGRGFPSYVNPREPVDEVLKALVTRAAYPYLTDVTVDWAGLDVHDATPQRLPDVFAGLPLTVSGRYSQPGKATIHVKATTAGRRVDIPLEVELPAAHAEPGVAYLWARQRVEELLARDLGQIDDATRRAVEGIGLQFHMVTEFTSFVAVDRTRVVENGGKVRTIVQPVPIPEGVNMATAIGGAEAGYAASQSSYSSSSSSSHSSYSSGGGGGWGSGGDETARNWPGMLAGLALVAAAAAALARRRARGGA